MNSADSEQLIVKTVNQSLLQGLDNDDRISRRNIDFVANISHDCALR